jgi:hypothetical protein
MKNTLFYDLALLDIYRLIWSLQELQQECGQYWILGAGSIIAAVGYVKGITSVVALWVVDLFY